MLALQILGYAAVAVAAVAAVLGALVAVNVLKKFKPAARGGDIPPESIAKQGCSRKSLPATADVVVIGSGMGGLTTAVLLARQGKRVVVLEQHDVAGGCTHVFEDQGFEFDTGVHYLGATIANPATVPGKLFRLVTDGKVQYNRLHDEYDIVVLEREKRRFAWRSGFRRCVADLKAQFPSEANAIDKYFAACKKSNMYAGFYVASQLLPSWMPLAWLRKKFLVWAGRTPMDIVSKYTSNKELQAVLLYRFGDLGLPPRTFGAPPLFLQPLTQRIADRASFAVDAMIQEHYAPGAVYPVGGSSVFARCAIPIIEQSGGKVLVRARVSKILVENGRAVGVETDRELQIRAPVIVSSIGVFRTFQDLVPIDSTPSLQPIRDQLTNRVVKPSCAHLSLFLGCEGDPVALGLQTSNFWIFPHADLCKVWEDSYADPLNCPFFGCFVSFPSLKDPTFASRHPGKFTVEVVTEAPYSLFEAHANERVKHRAPEYEQLKKQLTQRMLDTVFTVLPQLQSAIRYADLGTPLSSEYYIGSFNGSSYGLAHDAQRFEQTWLHPTTPLPGLYLSGQDVMTCGVTGAVIGGALAAFHAHVDTTPTSYDSTNLIAINSPSGENNTISNTCASAQK